MGNAVGPVALIAAGIYLGYLTITGRAANFANFLASGGKSVTAASATTTTAATTAAAGSAGNLLGTTPNSTLSTVTNPWGIMNATPQQQLINSQIPLTIDPLAGTSGG